MSQARWSSLPRRATITVSPVQTQARANRPGDDRGRGVVADHSDDAEHGDPHRGDHPKSDDDDPQGGVDP